MREIMKNHRKILTVIVLCVLVACAAPPKAPIDLVYSGLSESLPRLNPFILEGRKILLDPGHGGYFRGTVGQDSLEEARVNLGVALYLWGLLNEAGAEVTLTRSAERDFLSDNDSLLATDLETRISPACSLEFDIFISIHHNAQSDRDPDANRVETYYRTGDPASMDLAFAIHRHLMRNLGISLGEVRQGNYFVLRNTEMPAVLGEASYLTHPLVEKSLKLSEKQRLEAEAYFLGILEYFHKGLPLLHRLSPPETILTTVPSIVYQAEDVGGLGLDSDAIHMVLNGQKVEPVFGRVSGRITYQLPWDAPNGSYSLSLTARNLQGNSSQRSRCSFTIAFPPEMAVFAPHPSTLPPGGGILRIRSRLLDRRGLSIADGTPVEISAEPGTTIQKAVVQNGFLEFPVIAPAETESLSVSLLCRESRFRLVVKKAPTSGAPIRGTFIIDHLTGEPVTGATIILGDSVIQTGSQVGFYLIPTPRENDEIHVRALGYRPLTFMGGLADTLRVVSWFDGILNGKRFMINPEGGTASVAGAGKLGLSGAYVNLQVARFLSGYLRSSGAQVRLTRQTEETRTPQDIAALTNRFGADRYLEIRHRSTVSETVSVARVFHFPGSRLGADLAERLSFSLSGLLELPLSLPEETVTYPLQQTACPAVVIDCPSLDTIDEELRLGEAWYQRRQAYSIFLGILSHFEVPDRASLEVRITGVQDPANWLVVLDGTWKLLTGPDGFVRFHALPEGIHSVEIQRKNSRFLKQIVLFPDIQEKLIFHAVPETGSNSSP